LKVILIASGRAGFARFGKVVVILSDEVVSSAILAVIGMSKESEVIMSSFSPDVNLQLPG
jgi:hypothetical protein